MTTRDSVLVIRAKDEAQSTIKAIGKSLNDLLAGFRNGGDATADFAKGMAAIDKAMGKLSDQAESAEAAFKRVNDAIGAKRSDVQGVTQQLLAATEALAKFNSQSRASAGKPVDFIGPLNFGPQIKAAEAAVASLEKQQTRLVTDIAKMESGIRGGTSSLQVMGSAANGLEAQIAGARAEIERTAQAAAKLRTINASTGVSRPAAADNGATVSALAARADAQANRDAAAAYQAFEQRVRDGIAAMKVDEAERDRRIAQMERERQELGKLAEANSLQAAIDRHTGTNRTAATAGGAATYSELSKIVTAEAEADAAVQARALKNAAAAHEAFEQYARKSVAVTKEQEAATQGEAAALQKLRDYLNPIAALERSTAAEVQKLVQWQKQGKISAEEMAAAEKLLGDQLAKSKDQFSRAVGGSGSSLFGLKPYELQNLSYQINDIFTQLASGTSITQTLGQQGGQILQIFPKAGSAIRAAFTSPTILTFGAAVTAAIVGLVRLNSEAGTLRTFQGALDASATGANYQAAALAEAAKGLDRYALSAEDAVKVVRTFVSAGLPQARIEQFGRTAKDLADILGISVVDAAKQMADGFDGSYQGIARLDDATNLLTASERERIRLLFEQGKAQEAMKVAFDAMSTRLEKGAQDMRGPWTDAINSMSNAWSSFVDAVAKWQPLQQAAGVLDDMAKSAGKFFRALSGDRSLADIKDDITQVQALLNADKNKVGYSGPSQYLTDELKRLQTELRFAEAKANGGAVGGQVSVAIPAASGAGDGFGEDPKTRKTSNDTLAQMNREGQLQDLREKGQRAVNDLRIRNEAFLTAAEKRRREQLAGELAYTKAVGDERVKSAAREKAVRDEHDKIQQEQDSYTSAATTPQMLARKFIAERENFKSKAYWDVNHFRAGFGSDTTTSATGAVSTVTRGTTVSMEDAVRDLDRRIKEFQDAIKTKIGSDRFNSFSPEQQAAVTSIAYNYGKLPERIVEALRHGTAQEISAAIRGLGGDNKGINRNRRDLEAGTFTSSNVALNANTEKQAEDLAVDQEKFVQQVDAGNDKLALRTRIINEQSGLHGTALLDAQAQAAADEAQLAILEKVKQENETRKAQGKELLFQGEEGKKQLDALLDRTGRLAAEAVKTDPRAAEMARDDATRPVNDLTAQRDAIQQQIELQKAQGNGDAVKPLQDSLKIVNSQLADAISKAQTFFADPDNAGLLAALGYTADQIKTIRLGLENAKLGTQQWVAVMGVSGQTIAQNLSSGVAGAFDQFAKSVANGANAFRSLGQAFLQFAANFTVQIAQMIAQQEFFNLISGLLKAGGSAAGSVSSGAAGAANGLGAVGGLQAHSGGVIGMPSTYGPDTGARAFNAAWLATARRYHDGGIAGLTPGEIPTVLMRGEEVLTRDDPRHIMNGGGMSAAPAATPQDIKIVNAIDSGHMLSEAMNTSKGQRAIVNFIRQNARSVNSALKV